MRIFIIQETISVSNIFIQRPKIKINANSISLHHYLLFIAAFLDDEKCIPSISVLRDVTAATFVSLNKGTAVLSVSPVNPTGIELYSYGNVFFRFG